jgi:hypothetical protein
VGWGWGPNVDLAPARKTSPQKRRQREPWGRIGAPNPRPAGPPRLRRLARTMQLETFESERGSVSVTEIPTVMQ